MCNFTTFKSILECAVRFLEKQVVPLLMSLALLLFLWGVFIFIKNGGDETKREEGKQLMFWGIVGLFVMLTVWSLVAVIAGGGRVFIPQL